MTDNRLPVIAEFIDAPNDAARARILLACPDAIIAKYRETWRTLSDNRDFAEGVDFLAAHHAAAHAIRGSRGELAQEVQATLDETRHALAKLASVPSPSIDI